MTSSFKRNIAANYVGQFYVAIVSIVMLPLYIDYMGIEAYGLVGFFAMLQAWFQLLDMGLTPTMSREVARFNGGAGSADTLRGLLRALEGVFAVIALCGAASIIFGSGFIARKWLNVESLPLAEVEHALALMAVVVALRWVAGLYRGAISGFERLVWLNTFNVVIATVRFVLVIPYFVFVGASLAEFFIYQLAVAVLELLVLAVQAYRLLPPAGSGSTSSRWSAVRDVLKFSLGVAFTGSVWVFVTQTDKLVLSRLLSLTDYAHFSLAVLAASGVLVVSGPVSAALLPRLSRLSAMNDESGLFKLYRTATQLVAVVAVPVSITLAVFSEHVLLVWTGDHELAAAAAKVLTLYAAGNGVLAFAAFPYYLQFAKGDLRLHMIGNLVFILVLVPSLVFATLKFGMIGAGYAWLGSNLVYLLLWIPRVHVRFAPKLHVKWLFQDIGPVVACTAAAAFLLSACFELAGTRLQVAFGLAVVGMALLVISVLASSSARAAVQTRFHRIFAA